MALIPLTAGPLTMDFDSDIAFLRYIHVDGTEALRGIFAAVRDADWNTVPFQIDDLTVEQTGDSFSLQFQANGLHDQPPFRWHGQITGSSSGIVEFSFRGTALRSFLRNRIGLCVLHPTTACAGRPCQIQHVDGTTTDGAFPKFISPHQPFKNIRAITHPVRTDIDFRVTMLGETFEMEDQRNWTDASFKTYSTPLELPFPVEIPVGTVLEQSVKLELIGNTQTASVRPSKTRQETRRMEVDWRQSIALPKLGFSLPSLNEPLPPAVIDGLRLMHADHLRVELRLDDPQWRSEFHAASELAHSLGTQLELALFISAPYKPACDKLADVLSQSPAAIARVILLETAEKVTPAELQRAAQLSLLQFNPGLTVVVGTDAYFAELNRGRPSINSDNLVGYSLNPQVHAFDKLSIAETLAAQADTVDSAVNVFQTGVVVSPITLRPRFNPNATSKLDRRSELTAAIDPRQDSGFAAAWTAGVLAHLGTHRHVRSLTFFETHGPRGICDTTGQPFAMSEVFRWALQSSSLVPVCQTQAWQVVGFGGQQHDRSRYIVLGNLSDQTVSTEVVDETGVSQRTEVAPESVRVITWEERSHA